MSSYAERGPAETRGQRIIAWVIAVLGTNVVVLLMNVGTGVLSARVMGPAGKGIYNAVILWPSVFGSLTSGGLYASFTTVYGSAPPASRRNVWVAGMVVGFGWSIAGVVACGVLAPRFLHHLGSGISPWVLAGSLLLLPGNAVATCSALLAVEERFSRINWLNAARTAVFTLALAVLALAGHLTPYSQLIASWAAMLVASAGIFWVTAGVLRQLPRPAAGDAAPYRRLFLLGLGFYTIMVASLFNGQLDQVLSSIWMTAREIGLYAVASSALSLVAMITSAFSTVFFPMAVRDAGADVARRTTLGFRRGLIVLALAAVGLGAVAAPGLRLVYGVSYWDTLHALFPLLPGSVCIGGVTILYQGCFARRMLAIPAVGELVGAISGAVLLWLFIPRWHLMGAGLATSISFFLDLVVVAAAWIRQNRLPAGALVPTAEDSRAVLQIAMQQWDRVRQRGGRWAARLFRLQPAG